VSDEFDTLESIEPTDQALLALVRAGDEDAAKQLYEKYARRVFGLVRSKMSDRMRTDTEPEDLVQSVFRSIFRGVCAGSYDAPDGETLWSLVAVIAANKVREKGRQNGAARRDSSRSVPLESAVNELASGDQAVEMLQLSIRETLELLRETDREILTLRMQGHTVEEVATKTGRARRTVERSLQNSRVRLADLLG